MNKRNRDRLRYLGARATMRLPDRLKLWLSGRPAVIIDGQQLDAQVQLLGSVRRRAGGTYGLIEPTIEAGRARLRRETSHFRGPITRVGNVRDFTIPGPGGDLRVRHYAPVSAAMAPLTVYLHGGGFVIGDLDTHDEPCRILCRFGHTHVLSVDYRCAPENPFPAAVEDATAAFAWARANAASLGADPQRVAIGGDSAGGNLSAVVAHTTRGTSAPKAQLLIYPPTDHKRRRSHELFGEGFFLTNRDREAFGKAYAAPRSEKPNPLVSPLYFSDFSGLPPALVVIAGFDILRDEGEEYAAKLAAAGTPTRVQRYVSLGHGFIHLTGICTTARRAMIAIAEEWRRLVRDG